MFLLCRIYVSQFSAVTYMVYSLIIPCISATDNFVFHFRLVIHVWVIILWVQLITLCTKIAKQQRLSLILTRMVPISKSMACEEFDWIIDVKMSDNLDAGYSWPQMFINSVRLCICDNYRKLTPLLFHFLSLPYGSETPLMCPNVD